MCDLARKALNHSKPVFIVFNIWEQFVHCVILVFFHYFAQCHPNYPPGAKDPEKAHIVVVCRPCKRRLAWCGTQTSESFAADYSIYSKYSWLLDALQKPWSIVDMMLLLWLIFALWNAEPSQQGEISCHHLELDTSGYLQILGGWRRRGAIMCNHAILWLYHFDLALQ